MNQPTTRHEYTAKCGHNDAAEIDSDFSAKLAGKMVDQLRRQFCAACATTLCVMCWERPRVRKSCCETCLNRSRMG